VVARAAPRQVIEVLRPVRVEDEHGAFAELRPNSEAALDAVLDIEFPNTAIGHQSLSLRITPETFRGVLAEARTFTLAQDVARLREAGLALGGSLANAVVVDGLFADSTAWRMVGEVAAPEGSRALRAKQKAPAFA